MIDPPAGRVTILACGQDCGAWVNWRGSKGKRTAWKAACTVLLLTYIGWFVTLVSDSLVQQTIGVVFASKLLIEAWGQDTPTWVVPGTVQLFVIVYVVGIPSIVGLYGYCREVDVDIPYRELLGLALYLFGSTYSLSYELHRFWWKAKPENKGKLHTTGLARFCIHPNYFGDLFTYFGWGLAAGTQCAMSITPAALFYLTLCVIPNSDAYLAKKYPDEFPQYLESTARLIPGLRSQMASYLVAWAGLAISMLMEISCGKACGMA